MAVIVGSSTNVIIEFPNGTVNAGIISVDWSFGTNLQRLYTLGQGLGACGPEEFATIRSSDVTVNFSIYGGNTPVVDVCAPSEGCVDSPAQAIVTIAPGYCGNNPVDGLNAQAVYINSYGYNKDRTGFGTETWAGTAYVQGTQDPTNMKFIEPEPDYNILGIAEGTIEGEIDDLTTLQTIVGAEFRDVNDVVTTGRGNVAAAQISLGDYTEVHNGTFSSIGSSLLGYADAGEGILARANVTVNVQPVYTGGT